MKLVRFLAISPQCIEPINREVYRYLSTKYKININLIIPSKNLIGGKIKKCLFTENEPFKITLLDPIGYHPRLQRFRNLKEVVLESQPTHIFVDADPATLLTKSVISAAKKINASLWAFSLENIRHNYLCDGFKSFLNGHILDSFGNLSIWLLYRLNNKKIQKVFTVCKDGSEFIIQQGFKGRVIQIPLGIDNNIFCPQSREKIDYTRKRLGLTETTIAYFGRLIPEKGVDLLLQALANLKDLSWQLLIDRFSDYKTPYVLQLQEQIERLGLTDRVIYFDATHTEMPDYMNAADVVVLPSITTPKFKEQYGRVIPEAMACGKIVICSQSGALPELIKDCGFIFPEGNVSALKNTLCNILSMNDEGLSLIRQKAIQRAQDDLSVKKQADIWFNIMLSTMECGIN